MMMMISTICEYISYCIRQCQLYIALGWKEINQQDATNPKFIIKLLSQHVSGIIMPIISARSLRPKSIQPQPAKPVQNTICSNTRSCSPEDGHNDARNMLSQKLIINIWLLHLVGFFSLFLPTLLTMHGHRNLNLNNERSLKYSYKLDINLNVCIEFFFICLILESLCVYFKTMGVEIKDWNIMFKI